MSVFFTCFLQSLVLVCSSGLSRPLMLFRSLWYCHSCCSDLSSGNEGKLHHLTKTVKMSPLVFVLALWGCAGVCFPTSSWFSKQFLQRWRYLLQLDWSLISRQDVPSCFIAFQLTPAGLVKLWEENKHFGPEHWSTNAALECWQPAVDRG